MKVLIAPQGFKGSMDAPEVAECIARGVRQVFRDATIVLLPIADGGEGTVQALVRSAGGELVRSRVLGPLGAPVDALWGILPNGTAVIEMAAASGLPLIARNRRNPSRTSTYGTGELILRAVERGARRLIVGVGGSATNDGGAGMAQALGVRLLDAAGNDLARGGGHLRDLVRIDVSGLDPRLVGVEVIVATDVNNPLCGPSGASHVYGPQKGATPRMVRELDAGLRHYAEIVAHDLGRDVAGIPGAGAGGGLAAGLVAFLGASIRRGVEVVFAAIDVDGHLQGVDLVFTGEGKMDQQDIYGKGPIALAQAAARHGIPSVAIVGSTTRDYGVVFDYGLDALIGVVTRPMPLDRAIAETADLLTEAATRACRLIRVGQYMSVRQP